MTGVVENSTVIFSLFGGQWNVVIYLNLCIMMCCFDRKNTTKVYWGGWSRHNDRSCEVRNGTSKLVQTENYGLLSQQISILMGCALSHMRNTYICWIFAYIVNIIWVSLEIILQWETIHSSRRQVINWYLRETPWRQFIIVSVWHFYS